jgi:hypothetical protein
MRWFRWPSPPHREEWAKQLIFQGTSEAMPITPPPAPRELVEVLGLGMTETVNGVALTLLSLERYREGDIITFRLTSKRGFHLEFPSPELFLAVGPAASTSTPRFSMTNGGGGGNGNDLSFRYSYGVSPGMPDQATDWVVEVTKIEWVRPYRSPERKIASVDVGPWRFRIKP